MIQQSIQRDDNNFVEKIYGKEVYAAGVGLIYKERDDLRKTSGIVVSGTEFKMVVSSYGNWLFIFIKNKGLLNIEQPFSFIKFP